MTALPRVGCYYTVTPGLGKPEWFPDTFDGLTGKKGALARAMFASVGGPPQQVTVTRGRTTTLIGAYEHGKPVHFSRMSSST